MEIFITNLMVHTNNHGMESLALWSARLEGIRGPQHLAMTSALPMANMPYSMSALDLLTVAERMFMTIQGESG